MKKLYNIFLTLSVMAMSAVTLSSCRQDADDLESQLFLQTNGTSLKNSLPETYTEQFDALWNGMNQNYVGWQLETFDWDEVYRTKRAVPEAWDARLKANPNDTVSNDEFFKFYEDILNPFTDGHLTVFLWNMRTKECKQKTITPGNIRLMKRDNYRQLLKVIAKRNECVTRYRSSLWYYTLESLDKRGQLAPIDELPIQVFRDPASGFMAELAVIKTANGKYVPYLHWNSFRFTSYLNDEKEDGCLYEEGTASAFLKTYGDVVKAYGEAGLLGGVILDVRGNTGGDTGDYAFLLGRLLKPGTNMILGTTVHKNGVGRLDYSPSTPFGFAISDFNQYVVSKEPIVLLCDGRSLSMSEMTTYSVKLLPNGHVIGDRTFGGFNFLDMQYDRTYAGSFGDRAAGPFYVYTPCALTTPIDGTQIEGVGIMPDEYIPYDDAIVDAMTSDLTNITDAHIEAAIKYIQGKN